LARDSEAQPHQDPRGRIQRWQHSRFAELLLILPQSLDLFVRETTDTIHKSLIVYVDNLFALAKTNANFAEHASSMVTKISADKDQERLKLVIAPSKALSIPKRVLYENAHVGVCPDICFGISLVDYATSRGLPEGAVPRILKLCLADLEARGLEAEGIYRVCPNFVSSVLFADNCHIQISGKHTAVQELVHKIERDERSFRFDPHVEDVYCVSSLLKVCAAAHPQGQCR